MFQRHTSGRAPYTLAARRLFAGLLIAGLLIAPVYSSRLSSHRAGPVIAAVYSSRVGGIIGATGSRHDH